MDLVVPPENLITTPEQLAAVAAHYLTVDAFVFDVETMGENRGNPRRAPMAWLCLATYGRCDVIPMAHPHGDLISERPAPLKTGRTKLEKGKTYEELRPSDLSKSVMERTWTPKPKQLNRSEVIAALRPLFMDPDITKVGQNVKFDVLNVAQYLGCLPSGPFFDTHIAAWLLDVTKKGQLTLGEITERFVEYKMEKGVGKEIEAHGFGVVSRYSYLDGRYTWLDYIKLLQIYAGLDRVDRNLLRLEMNTLEPVLMMESTGVRIDTDELAELDTYFRDGIEVAREMAQYHAHRAFNLNSNTDKQDVLFGPKSEGGQGITPSKLTKGGETRSMAGETLTIRDYSVDKESLEDHANNKVVMEIQRYSSLSKLLGTYVTPYLGGERTATTNGKARTVEVASQLDLGRIHGRFNQTGAESGRFSSSEPNLQNIPARSEEGKKLRKVFLPDEGHTLVVADYSQIEPRIIATLANDRAMLDTYREGGDVYQMVADRLNVTRPVGKELVLSIAYGVGPATISVRTGMRVTQARDLMDYFASHFYSIPQHKAKVISHAKRNKYAITMYGRVRRLPALGWKNQDERAKAERQAYNHTIQGSAADLMKFALVAVYDALVDEFPEARLLLTVHDEVVITAPTEQAEDVAALVKREMESIGKDKLAVGLVADVGTGPCWADAKG